jgi:hypothetical protein
MIDEALTRFVGRAKTVDDATVVILKESPLHGRWGYGKGAHPWR